MERTIKHDEFQQQQPKEIIYIHLCVNMCVYKSLVESINDDRIPLSQKADR